MKKIALILINLFCITTIQAEISWRIEDKKLIISGNGDMNDYDQYGKNVAPWLYGLSYNFNITTVEIEEGVTSIGDWSFNNCGNLSSISIPKSITKIGNRAFSNCYNLKSIDIPQSVICIGENAFYRCKALSSVYLPNSVAIIGRQAFQDCDGISSLTISSGMTSIEYSTFWGCTGLTSINIPNSITNIRYGAFYGCTGLTSINIPGSVKQIDAGAFQGCCNIEKIEVSDINLYYDSRNDCNAIIRKEDNYLILGCNNTVIPNSVAGIEEMAFEGYKHLSSIEIPKSVVTIGSQAFTGCGIKSVTIPESVTYIGDYAFGYCDFTSIIIPYSVTELSFSAFEGCKNLKEATFFVNDNLHLEPSFSDILFEGCPMLEKINMHGNTVPTKAYKIFSESQYNNIILTVPSKLLSTYCSASPWRYFNTIKTNDIIELNDNEKFNNNVDYMTASITYTRTFNNTSWQSLYIPFSMTYDDWKDDFEVAYINGIRQMDTDDDGAIDETIMDVVKIKSGSLIPNTPYLIKAKTTGNKTITVNNATLYKAESNSVDCSTTIAKYTFTGTYSTIPAATLLANNYYAMGGGSLIMTDGTSDLKPFRWYLNVESRSPMYNVSSGAKAITINVVGEEEATGISQMSSDREHSSAIYDLNGRRMSQKTLKSGLYIKNGKKIIIK